MTSNQWAFKLMATHLPSSAQVRLLSCCSVLAVTMHVPPSRVLMNQWISHPTNADLPGPRPDATALL